MRTVAMNTPTCPGRPRAVEDTPRLAHMTQQTADLFTAIDHVGVAVSDLDAAWWTAGRPVMGGLLYDGSTVVLPPGPGLGVEGLA